MIILNVWKIAVSFAFCVFYFMFKFMYSVSHFTFQSVWLKYFQIYGYYWIRLLFFTCIRSYLINKYSEHTHTCKYIFFHQEPPESTDSLRRNINLITFQLTWIRNIHVTMFQYYSVTYCLERKRILSKDDWHSAYLAMMM